MRWLAKPQCYWDWRAATNFMFGGTGGSLLAASALAAPPGASTRAAGLAALALMALGLTMVWLEIGRPWRAVHVFFRPQNSWMTREAYVAVFAFAAGAGWLLGGLTILAPVAGLLGLAFLGCQAMILHASKGVPAWREPALAEFVVATGLAEGASALLIVLILVAAPLSPPLAQALAVLLVLRAVAWLHYRARMARDPMAGNVLRAIGVPFLWVGNLVPLFLVLVAAALPAAAAAAVLAATAATLLAGWWAKHAIVTRLCHLQGYGLGPRRRGHPLGAASNRRRACELSPTLSKTRARAR